MNTLKNACVILSLIAKIHNLSMESWEITTSINFLSAATRSEANHEDLGRSLNMMNEQLKRADERAKAAEKKVMNKMMIMMAAVVVVTRMTMLKLLLWVLMVVKLTTIVRD